MIKSKNLLDKTNLNLLFKAVEKLESGFSRLPELKNKSLNKNTVSDILNEVAKRMMDNFPYFHPFYAGQMLKPPHEIARLSYMLALWINPNNHALDGGRASSIMEKEAVAEIAKMFGWKKYLGHLTGGGTMANLEALWVAGQIYSGKKILASTQAHYTHSRLSNVLGLSFESVPCDNNGKMDITKLKEKLEQGNVGTVVATIGTTALGAIDPLNEILKLRKKYGFRIHADAAYGGYFILSNTLTSNNKINYSDLPEVDSLVIDPHKHGLQPYGCGCVLFKDPTIGKFYKHNSPYTYFSSDELHLGEISLECSRPGAAAVALWATLKLFPLKKNGEFAKMLSDGRKAALKLFDWLQADSRFITGDEPDLDITCWIPKAISVSKISDLSRRIFNECAKNNLHLALVELPVKFFNLEENLVKIDKKSVTCLRSVLMKQDHLEWIDKIISILSQSTDKILKNNIDFK